ncbi:unnamed protein product [Rodentolepis nana]|uniref:Protein kinase domain-containing protein n=1 Tax=Rodentolepis nana TaxID=102285 RepID=A0A158QHE5_RODNA|nr:unnamed protein product [Rodentolepis nana]
MSRSHSPLAAENSPNNLAELQEIRDEIVSLRQKFDKDFKVLHTFLIRHFQVMRNAVTGDKSEIAQVLNKPVSEGKFPTHRIDHGEAALPESSILSSAHRAFLDAVRHRRAFEINVANCERSQAQKDVFHILGHLHEDNADAIRMRALLDDAVHNMNSIQSTPIASKATSSRLDRLSAPKKQLKLAPPKRRTKLTTNQRPNSSPPKRVSSTVTPRSTGLADLVYFSDEESTTAPPLMRRPKVVLKTPPSLSGLLIFRHHYNPLLPAREKAVRFDKTHSKSTAPMKPNERKSKPLTPFVPLGMRQYTMWPTEKSQSLVTTSMENGLGGEADRLTAEDVKTMLEAALNQHSERKSSQLQVQDRDVGTSCQAFTEEKALSPIPTPKKTTLVDATSTSVPLFGFPSALCFLFCWFKLAFCSALFFVQEPLIIYLHLSYSSYVCRPQSPIFTPDQEVSASITKKEFESIPTVSGFSQTDAQSFSDGVWLDPDRSEGEYGGIPIRVIEQASLMSKELGPLPSMSATVSQSGDEESIHSEGEFTLDQVAKQSAGWVAPWRDPLLHLIALGTSNVTSKLPWNQQQKIKKAAVLLDERNAHREVVFSEPDEIESSSADDLSWVKRIASTRRAKRQAEALIPQTADKSNGEVSVTSSVKEFRRAILARSSQKMRQREASLSEGW